MPRTSTGKATDPEVQLRGLVEKFGPQHQAVFLAAGKSLWKHYPTATELVYDNFNFFVIGFLARTNGPRIASSR